MQPLYFGVLEKGGKRLSIRIITKWFISRIKPVASDTVTQISRLPSGIPVDRNTMLPPRFIRLNVVPLPSVTEVQEMAAFFKVLVKL